MKKTGDAQARLSHPEEVLGLLPLIEFESDPSLIAKLETEYRRDERAIRFLTVAMDKHHIAFAESRPGRGGKSAGDDGRAPRTKKETA